MTFDLAMFAEHARDDAQGQQQPLFCPRIVVRPTGQQVPWQQRWRPVLPDMENWASGDRPWIDDLAEIAKVTASRSGMEIGDFPGVSTLLDLEIRSLLVLGISEGEQLVASIMIGSNETGAYDAGSFSRLANGPAESVGRSLLAERRERREALVREDAHTVPA
jgi:hypothetical protein